jgi:hypothetical protein
VHKHVLTDLSLPISLGSQMDMSHPSELHNQRALGVSELTYVPTDARERPVVAQSSQKKWMMTAIIVGGWLFAVAFSVAHWRYGVLTDDHLIPSDADQTLLFALGSQDSTKSVVSALTRAMVLSLTVASAAILTQMVSHNH